MARIRLGGVVRVVLTLFVGLLIVAWLTSTRLPRAVPAPALTAAGAPVNEDAAPAPQNTPLPERGKLYIWRDASGSTHIESEPPPQHVKAEEVPFIRRTRKQPVDGAPAGTSAEEPAPPAPHESGWNPAVVYTPEGFEELLRQIEETARRLEKRNEQVEDLAKQL